MKKITLKLTQDKRKNLKSFYQLKIWIHNFKSFYTENRATAIYTGKFYQILKKQLVSILQKNFQKTEEEKDLHF